MTMFSVLSIAGSGAEAMQTWIDTSAGNIANADDATPVGTRAYAEQTPVLSPVGPAATSPGVLQSPGGGVVVSQIALGTSKGVVAFEPTSPLANARGDVVVPNVDLADQMVGLVEAQDSYEGDTAAMAKAQAVYSAGLTIGS